MDLQSVGSNSNHNTHAENGAKQLRDAVIGSSDDGHFAGSRYREGCSDQGGGRFAVSGRTGGLNKALKTGNVLFKADQMVCISGGGSNHGGVDSGSGFIDGGYRSSKSCCH